MKKLTLFLLTAVLLTSTNIYCHVQDGNQNPNLLKYDNGGYEQAWKTIDSLDRKRLPKSALEHVEALYERAKKDNNPSQIIKTVIYREKYQSQLEEDGYTKAIYRIQQEMETAEFPMKPILQSMLGEAYISYLDRNYWKFNDRTETVDFDNKDISTWSVKKLSEESNLLFNASLDHTGLEDVAINNFGAITTKGRLIEKLRPTLFDFLAHRAIDHFMNERNYLTDPAYAFSIQDKLAFAPVKEFVTHSFQSKDKNSNKYNTLLLFQKLLKLKLEKGASAELVDADLKRLKFVKSNAVLSEKETLYLEALKSLLDQNKENEASAEITFYIAEHYYNRGTQYTGEENDEKKWDFKKANVLCENVVKQYPGAYGAGLCNNLLTRIHSKSLNMQSELVNVPGKPILAKMSYTNVSGTHMKLVRMSHDEWENFHTKREKEIFRFFNKKTPLKEWQITLPDDGDFRMHTIEFAIDPMETGIYAVLASADESFEPEGNGVSYLVTHVSNIAYLNRNEPENNAHTFLVTNRESGHPEAGVQFDFFERKYNSRSRENDFIKIGTIISDEEGKVVTQFSNTRHFQVTASKGKDRLNLREGYNSYNYGKGSRAHSLTHFFTDRSIYRPGQTIHFKALLVEKNDEGMPSISANAEVTVTLYDANGQEKEKLKLRSNEYGTVNGIFKAPRGGLMGQMSLRSSFGNGYHSFRVEEYKRPKFEVTFKPVEGSYRLGDEVEITGHARALAGNNIDGAKVQYRIVREARFPYFPWWRYGGWGRIIEPSNSMEIGNGTLETDEKGEFQIKFEAIPDLNISKDKKPEFVYRVYADVTDINGETRSGDTRVKAGYIALDISVLLEEENIADSLKQIEIASKNLNGNFEAAEGTVKIQAYLTPGKVYHERYWQHPDKTWISEADFKSKFPHLPFRNEDKVENWKVGKTVFEQNFNTKDNTKLSVSSIKFKPGKYLLTLNTKDKYGAAIELKKMLTVIDFNSGQVPSNEAFFAKAEKRTYEPGETVVIHLGSAEKNLRAYYELEHDGEIVTARWIDIGKLQQVKIPVKEKHRGNLHYHFIVVHHNRVEKIHHTIIVPWSNKDLTVEYASFRDKLKPGQKEEWQVKIKGPKSSVVAAEMLASMYDASLDFFVPHNWGMSLYPVSSSRAVFRSGNFAVTDARHFSRNWQPKRKQHIYRNYKQLNWFGFPLAGNIRHANMYMAKSSRRDAPIMEMSAAPAEVMEDSFAVSADADGAGAIPAAAGMDKEANALSEVKPATLPNEAAKVKVRTNLDETVFFMPELKTDAEGNIIIAFDMNEALTRWKFQGFVHTTDLKFGFTEKEIVTQKELMVVPNAPRFMREGDAIEYTAKVSNLTTKALTGTARLELFDAISMDPADQLMNNNNNSITFTVNPGQSERLAWKLNVPTGKLPALTHRVIARAGDYSDGEESTLPVLTNRMLVTESKVMYVRSGQTRTFEFEAMEKAGQSNTLQQHNYTLEFTSNPAWYAVQSLPYLMEYPYECTEQIFNRFYANTLASHVANANPQIQKTFKSWENTDAMLSNLSKNQELKSALLEETPWVLQAQSEEEQKKNIALLFDLNRMAEEQATALTTIMDRQLSNGGFSWFPGGRDSWYITQYIVESMGHLHKLNVKHPKMQEAQSFLDNANGYIDERIVEHYQKLEERIKNSNGKMSDDHLDHMAVHYLYASSFFDRGALSEQLVKVRDYYLGQAEKYWPDKSFYLQGMIALALHRTGRTQTSADIVKSFRERAIQSDELGMYWNMDNGYMWYQLPIESHALMIELFDEIANDQKAVDELRIWLLKNKQTTHWKTTKATSSAIYALLLRGTEWLGDTKIVGIKMGGKKLKLNKAKKEEGSGYFKKAWKGADISNSMATIEVSNPNKVVAWGAAYWQYFEQLDKIKTFEETPLTLKKQLFLEKPGDQGPVISPVDETTKLQPGDKLKVRIELRVDRDMEYVHMKDARASGLEPINVLSQYKWQGGLGYYESTKDASTNFFIDYLRKGTYVFEYPLRVSHNGDFSNGITSIQCMYAPEFSSHSEGIRINIGE